jgi:ribosomal-protein-alanine N-acetyltransferase
MRIELERPTLLREPEFLAAVARSRKLYKGWATPPSTPERFRAYVAGLRLESRAGFFVVVKQTDALAGVINLSEIVRGSFQSAYLGYYAFEPFAGQGFLREGLQEVVRHAFRQLKLHRLEANIQPGNLRSLALAKQLGFRYEGFSPRYLKVGGRWRDHERWALLAR